MNCETFERWLDDGCPEAAGSSARAHASACARCAAALGSAREIDATLARYRALAPGEFTDQVMKPFEPLVEKLNAEMVKRLVEDDSSVPVLRGGFYYYSRQAKGLQYPVYCRRSGSLRAKEQVILDVNQLACGKKYMRVGDFEVSPDNKLAAFSTDTEGDEVFKISVKD